MTDSSEESSNSDLSIDKKHYIPNRCVKELEENIPTHYLESIPEALARMKIRENNNIISKIRKFLNYYFAYQRKTCQTIIFIMFLILTFILQIMELWNFGHKNFYSCYVAVSIVISIFSACIKITGITFDNMRLIFYASINNILLCVILILLLTVDKRIHRLSCLV
ncbi:hypothetical protein HZS_524 [Henneguya salminicola]|nr:hypothetical protein HZS_524 [Henneguya salminicola]